MQISVLHPRNGIKILYSSVLMLLVVAVKMDHKKITEDTGYMHIQGHQRQQTEWDLLNAADLHNYGTILPTQTSDVRRSGNEQQGREGGSGGIRSISPDRPSSLIPLTPVSTHISHI